MPFTIRLERDEFRLLPKKYKPLLVANYMEYALSWLGVSLIIDRIIDDSRGNVKSFGMHKRLEKELEEL